MYIYRERERERERGAPENGKLQFVVESSMVSSALTSQANT